MVFGLLFTCLLSFVNQFFWYRTSPLFVGTLVAQLLTYPLGKTMAKILPTRKFQIYRWSFSLNPGPFTMKEHCIITAMANATCVCLFQCLIIII
jgi:4-amino-4-deoxy-L-arabinose transferase-like glycosyltransferase